MPEPGHFARETFGRSSEEYPPSSRHLRKSHNAGIDRIISDERSWPALPPESMPRCSVRRVQPKPHRCHAQHDTEEPQPSLITHGAVDPLTELPYNPLDPRLLEAVLRADPGHCFRTIPGCLYYILRGFRVAPDLTSETFKIKLDVAPSVKTGSDTDDHRKNTAREATTYARVYATWLMTSEIPSKLCKIGPDGTVLISLPVARAIFVLRQAICAPGSSCASVDARFQQHLMSQREIQFDWGYVLQTELIEHYGDLWHGVVPDILATHKAKSGKVDALPHASDESKGVVMPRPYGRVDDRDQQVQMAQTYQKAPTTNPQQNAPSHVPTVRWIPWHPSNLSNKQQYQAHASVHLTCLQSGTVDPMRLQLDQVAWDEFRRFVADNNIRIRTKAEGRQARHLFWRASGRRGNYRHKSGKAELSAFDTVRAMAEADARRKTWTTGRVGRNNRSRVVRLLVHPRLLEQKLARFRKRSPYAGLGSTFRPTATTESRPAGSVFVSTFEANRSQHPGVANRISSIAAPSTPSVFATATPAQPIPRPRLSNPHEVQSQQVPVTPLLYNETTSQSNDGFSFSAEKRYTINTHNAQVDASNHANWEVLTRTAEIKGWSSERISVERLGAGPVLWCFCDAGRVARRCRCV